MQNKTTSQAQLSVCKIKRTLFLNQFQKYLIERNLTRCSEKNATEHNFCRKPAANSLYILCLQQKMTSVSNLIPSWTLYATAVLCCKQSLLNSNNILPFQYQFSSQDQGTQENSVQTYHLPTVSGKHLVIFPFLTTDFTFKLRILI